MTRTSVSVQQTTKVLIVEDSSTQRLILRSLLTKYFSCEVSQACDGAEALSMIEQSRPDLVLLDVAMPVLDGVETLRAIRSAPEFRSIPVVIVSGSCDRNVASQMIDLGVEDYLVKPLHHERSVQRLKRVFDSLVAPPDPAPTIAPPTTPEERTALLADSDAAFRAFASPLLGQFFKVTEAESGAEALQLAQHQTWNVVCVGEGLGLLSPVLLAKKFRASTEHANSCIVLMSRDPSLYHAEEGVFDDFVLKTDDADAFTNEVRQKVVAAELGFDSLRRLIGTESRQEIITAIEQTIGIMCSQHVTVQDGTATREDVDSDLVASATLDPQGGTTSVDVHLTISEQHARALCELVTQTGSTTEGAMDLVGELLNIVAGRIRTSLAKRGVKMVPGEPVVCRRSEADRVDGVVSVRVMTDLGQALTVSLGVNERGQAGESEAPPLQDGETWQAETRPGDAPPVETDAVEALP